MVGLGKHTGTFGNTHRRAKTIIWELKLKIEVALQQTLRELSLVPSVSPCSSFVLLNSILDSFGITEV